MKRGRREGGGVRWMERRMENILTSSRYSSNICLSTEPCSFFIFHGEEGTDIK